eukprot:s889_g22.t1
MPGYWAVSEEHPTSCSAYSKCAAAGLSEGACCPSKEGQFLDCCYSAAPAKPAAVAVGTECAIYPECVSLELKEGEPSSASYPEPAAPPQMALSWTAAVVGATPTPPPPTPRPPPRPLRAPKMAPGRDRSQQLKALQPRRR